MKKSSSALCRRSFYILRHGYFTVISMLSATVLYFNFMSQKIDQTHEMSNYTLLNISKEMLVTSMLCFCIVTGGALFYEFIVRSEE